MPELDPRRFELKGKKAEAFLHDLAFKSFIADWCYPNAILGPGKEVDLLVVFDDTVIIWQAKDLRLDENGRYSTKEVQKNLRQLAGARRALFKLQAPISLVNPRRGSERFDPSTIRRVFLISALLGEPEDYGQLLQLAKEQAVHVFTREFTQIALAELDTIRDFTAYLERKERVFLKEDRPRLILMGGEEEILAHYLLNNRAFPLLERQASVIMLEGDLWEGLQKQPGHVRRKEADRISYGWDDMISRAHTSQDPLYERVAREMARLDRFQRRIASQSFAEAWVAAQDAPGNVFRRTVLLEDFTLCFLFADEGSIPRQGRKAMLEAQCFVARGLPEAVHNPKVIGIATEKPIEPTCSYDFLFLDISHWGEEEVRRAEELKETFDLFRSPTVARDEVDEYPL